MPAPRSNPKFTPRKIKKCSFCEEKVNFIDYKNLKTIYRYLTQYGKMQARYYSGVCLRHQKRLSRAVKLARIMALLPFVKR